MKKRKAKKIIKILNGYMEDYEMTKSDFAAGVTFGLKLAIVVIKRIIFEKPLDK